MFSKRGPTTFFCLEVRQICDAVGCLPGPLLPSGRLAMTLGNPTDCPPLQGGICRSHLPRCPPQRVVRLGYRMGPHLILSQRQDARMALAPCGTTQGIFSPRPGPLLGQPPRHATPVLLRRPGSRPVKPSRRSIPSVLCHTCTPSGMATPPPPAGP